MRMIGMMMPAGERVRQVELLVGLVIVMLPLVKLVLVILLVVKMLVWVMVPVPGMMDIVVPVIVVLAIIPVVLRRTVAAYHEYDDQYDHAHHD
ncbi:MAG: hypothetical protein FD123_3565 [Bacteroidetes bacterium]|nr:MAG: hypothetical protein FD123_3565 [Bacteroidota bacterium]